ncbi:MAG: hypothetical protein HZA15_06215 [Nitrospirae bacterium]|nr:hypothetical protein [Nitrospirota bacterium]
MSRGRMVMMLSASALGLAYSALLYWLQTLTGTVKGDGTVGVMLGLFICAHPAAGFLDMFFFEKDARYRFSLRWAALWWLVLDLLVLVIGWYVIFIGLTRLLGKGGYGWFPG